jgi:regulator of protease activity HflC (stomatin/prohibitin superfamily)
MSQGDPPFGLYAVVTLALLAIVMGIGMAGCPLYNVYTSEKQGQAELAQAQYNRQVKTLEAPQTEESAKHLAQAEIERARGVAEANKIIGQSLKDNEDYLRYLWIHNLAEAEKNGAQVIYVPTETNLPILEASRKPLPAAK